MKLLSRLFGKKLIHSDTIMCSAHGNELLPMKRKEFAVYYRINQGMRQINLFSRGTWCSPGRTTLSCRPDCCNSDL